MRRPAAIAMTLVLLTGCHGAGSSAAGRTAARTGSAGTSVAVHSTATGSGSAAASSATGSSLPSAATTSTGTSSAVRPSATATKSADEIIVGTPSSVTLEALLPVAPGKQRWTDQTFVVTGERAHRLVGELKAAPVYAGSAPAGCQPDGRRVTIRLHSGGRLLFFVSYCDLIWVGHEFGRSLASFAVVKDVENTVATRRPTTSARLSADQTLQVGLVIVPNKPTEPTRRAPGSITVTQDGKLMGSGRIKAGGHLKLNVAPGVYTLSAKVVGVHCLSFDATVVAAYGGLGTELNCPTT